MPADTAYLDASKISPAEIAANLAKKLGLSLYAGKASAVPPPKSSSWIGTVDFDYESFSGRFVIGDELYAFETHWTTSGHGSIHTYNDGANVNGVAISFGGGLAALTDASTLDFSSRSRTAQEGQLVVYRNNAGLYAVLKIEEVTERNGAIPSKLKFWYAINRDGSPDFSSLAMFD